MLTTVEATSAIRRTVPAFDSETVALDQAVGRVLRQSVHAERDQPPFDRVMMDGIAIRYADFENGTQQFPIQSRQDAGDPAQTLEPGKCIEIMTGASLPNGADCIVPVERIAVTDNVAEIESGYEGSARQFIHARASDHEQGTELLRPGTRVAAADVAIIASAGLPEIAVARKDRRFALYRRATNWSGWPVDMIEPQQIRLSNGPAVIAMLNQHGYSRLRTRPPRRRSRHPDGTHRKSTWPKPTC